MRFSATRIMLAVAAGGITAGGLVFWQSAGRLAAAAPSGAVLVVVKPIKAYAPIPPGAINVQYRPIKYVPKDAVASVGQTVGRRPTEDLFPGDVLVDEKLAAKGVISPNPLQVPPGMRAVTVAVDEVVGVGGFVQPGVRVDVVAVWTMSNGQNSISKVVLQNVPVLAVAQDPNTPDENRKAKVSSSVTLAVTPEQSEKLVLASVDGKIRLAMRSQTEGTKVDTKGATPVSLAGAAQPPHRSAERTQARPRPARVAHVAPASRPAARPPQPQAPRPKLEDPVQVINGEQIETVNL